MRFTIFAAAVSISLVSVLEAEDTPVSSYQNTVYLPYYRLVANKKQEAFDFSAYDPAPFLAETSPYASESIPPLEEYLLAGLATGRISQINYFRLLPSKRRNGNIDASGFFPSQMQYLHKLRQIYGVRLGICIAGSSSRYLPIMKNVQLRQIFAQNIVNFATTWDLNGVDFDWEYPRNKKEMQSYIALIQAVKKRLGQEKRVSVAVSRLQAALSEELFQAVDAVNFMGYDFTPRHSTMEDSQEMVGYLSKRYSIPSKKIFLGLPFYGKEIKTGRRRAKTYRRLAREYNLAPQDNEAGNYYFNGQDMVAQKFAFAREKDLGGIMIWEIGQDSLDHRSLLKALPRQK